MATKKSVQKTPKNMCNNNNNNEDNILFIISWKSSSSNETGFQLNISGKKFLQFLTLLPFIDVNPLNDIKFNISYLI
jgi:hypothetical protein